MKAAGHGFDGVERRGLMFVLSSPSGAGKTTLSRLLMERRQGSRCRCRRRRGRCGLVRSKAAIIISWTRLASNRWPSRANYWNGPLCSKTAMARRARRSRRRCRRDRTCCSISTGRARSNCGKKPRADVVSVFILPPSAADLEKRLHSRAQDSDEVIRRPDEPRQPRNEPLGRVRLYRRSITRSMMRLPRCSRS